MIEKLIEKNRSVRSFGDKKVTQEEMTEIMKCARLSSATRNLQGIKYITVVEGETCKEIFPLLSWAGAIKWNPSVEESPAAYVIMCGDKNVPLSEKYLYFDMGVVSENMLLKAREMGYGGCILAAFDKDKLKEILDIGEDYFPEIIVALGEPAEDIRIVDTEGSDTIYYRDEKNVHYVPKRPLKELIICEK